MLITCMVGQCLSWAMSKLPVNGFKWTDSDEINEEFIKNYNENDNKG